MTFKLVPAEIDDIKLFLSKLLQEKYISEDSELLLDRLLNQLTYIIKSTDGKSLGLVNLGMRPLMIRKPHAIQYYLRLIYILPEHRSKKIATDVLNELKNRYKHLWAIVDSQNIPACLLFKKTGWSIFKKNHSKILFVT